MNAKIAMVLVALIGVGLFALPQTAALFAGQHTFYNLDATGNQVPCQKCHGDVKAELSGQGVSAKTGSNAPHANFKCEYCHRAEQGYSSGDNGYGLVYYTTEGNTRSIVISVYDYETHAYPANISATEPTFADATGLSSIVGSISPPNGTGTLDYAGSSLKPTYNNGQPIDTNTSTRYTGFKPAAITDWTKTKRGYMEPTNLEGAGSESVNPGSKYHAASLVSCMECHGGEYPVGHYSRLYDDETGDISGTRCADCHYGAYTATVTDLRAGGFNLTNDALDTGEAEAHNAFVKTDPGNNILRFQYGAANAACVACHTHVAVDINFQKKYKIKLDANASDDGNWAVVGYAADGTVDISVYGNGSGGTFATSNHSINWDPGDTTLYINGTGQQITGLVNATDDDEAALTS